MRIRLRAAGVTAVLGAVALVASDTCTAQEVVAYAEGRPDVDYDAFDAAVPRFKELGRDALAEARLLNDLMEKLAQSEKDEAAAKEARAGVRDLLVKYRDNKVREAQLVDTVIKRKRTGKTDAEILKILHETELIGINWNKTKFIDCLRDLSQALGVTFVLHPDVLKFNTVEVSFPRSSADGILRAIIAGFECDYIVYDGEIVVIKTIKRNDKRLQDYLDRHPEWKYWRPEDVKAVEDDL
jgi:hypothetical protein